MKRERRIIYCLVLIILFLYVFRVSMLANLNVHDEEVAQKREIIKKLDTQNNLLEVKLLQKTALTTIEMEAQKRGMVKATKYVTPTIAAKTYIKK